MVVAERGSLADRSDFGFKKQVFRKRNLLFNGSNPLKVEIENNDVNLCAIQQSNDGSSPQPFDSSFGSSTATDNAPPTTTSKTSPASMLSSSSSSAQSPNQKAKIVPGRNWSPAIVSTQQGSTVGNLSSSLLLDFKASPPSSPAETEHYENLNENVILRKQHPRELLNRRGFRSEAGKPLKAALDKICRSTTPAEIADLRNKRESVIQTVVESNEALDRYIREVFWQLDHKRNGTVLKEDFELLCEVLSIAPTCPTKTSLRNSGIEWLSSYMPRTNSPLRFERLSEVKYKKSPVSVKSNSPPDTRPNFLFTLGPRPFWELWPTKKIKKKYLTVEEFKALLLERWSKCHTRNSQIFFPSNQQSTDRPERCLKLDSVPLSLTPNIQPNSKETRATDTNTRTQRIAKRVAKVAQRYLAIEKISRRIRNPSSATTVSANGCQSLTTKTSLQSSNIGSTDPLDGKDHRDRHTVNLAKSLEDQVVRQQTEIANLKSIIYELRSSLQLSDAQNLALQVLLKKMAKAESSSSMDIQSSHISNNVHNETLRSHTTESEEQLENLVRELKAMSQTKYPTTNTLMHHQQQHFVNGNGSSQGSFNQNEVVMEDELQETSKALKVVQDELQATQRDLKTTTSRLKEREAISKIASTKINTLYEALEKAQKEIVIMRSQLEEAQRSLQTTNEELRFTKRELLVAQSQLTHSDRVLLETELRLSLLTQSRQSLVIELQATRRLLASSLNLVHDLERESQKVPILEKQLQELMQSN